MSRQDLQKNDQNYTVNFLLLFCLKLEYAKLTYLLLLPLEKLDWKPLDKNVLEDFFNFDEPEYNPTFKPEQ